MRPSGLQAVKMIFGRFLLPIFMAAAMGLPDAGAAELHCDGDGQNAMLSGYEALSGNVWNRRHPLKIVEYFAPDILWHDAPAGSPKGVLGIARDMDRLAVAFPDRQVATDLVICADDIVLAHQIVTGTNSGSLLGAPATGKEVSAGHTEIYRLKDDEVVEMWGESPVSIMLLKSGWTLNWPGDKPAQPVEAALTQMPEIHCQAQDALLADYMNLFNILWGKRREADIDRFIAPDFHTVGGPPGAPTGPDAIRGLFRFTATAFPRRRLINDLIVCAGDLVAARQTIVAYADGPFMGHPGNKAKTISTWIDIYRFKDHKLIEQRGDGDTFETALQAGWKLTPP